MKCQYKTSKGCKLIYDTIGEWRNLPPSVCNDSCNHDYIRKNVKKDESCCGKYHRILKGFGRLISDEILGNKPEKWVIKRSEVCAECEHRTFLNILKWAEGFIFDKDEDLPVNHEPGRFDKLWCSKCKCCIEAKIRVKEERCPSDKWLGTT